jgi:hypothetical protein
MDRMCIRNKKPRRAAGNLGENADASGSVQPAALRHGKIRSDKNDLPVGIRKPQHQHVGNERADLSRRQIDDSGHLATEEGVRRVVAGNLCRGFALADVGAKVDPELDRRFPCLGKGFRPDHRADPDVHGGECLIEDGHGRIIMSRAAGKAKATTRGEAASDAGNRADYIFGSVEALEAPDFSFSTMSLNSSRDSAMRALIALVASCCALETISASSRALLSARS